MTGKLFQTLLEVSRKFDETKGMLTLGLFGQHQLFFRIGFRAARTAGLLVLGERIRSGLHSLQAPLQIVALVVSFLEIGFKTFHFRTKLADDLLVFRSLGVGRRRLRLQRAFPPGQVLLNLLERLPQGADFTAFSSAVDFFSKRACVK